MKVSSRRFSIVLYSMSPKDRIKERLSILDVVEDYVSLKKAGSSYKGLSPFTKEKSPSFFVSPDKGLFYCFSSGKGGDMFTFVQEIEGIDFKGALKLLATKAGIPLVELTKQGGVGVPSEEIDRWYSSMEEATQFFISQLGVSPDIQNYVQDRGVSVETTQHFRIGYAPKSWEALKKHLLQKGYSEKELETVGLIKQTERGPIDKFRDRIMFPIMDSSGRVVAFSGREFPRDDARGPKYLNSPDTPLFKKSEILFALDKAKTAIRKFNFSILVEGQFDVVLLHQAGFTNTVAASGTALTDEEQTEDARTSNLGLLKRLSSNIVLAFDSDSAGQRAALRSARILQVLDMDVKVVGLPQGKDPADILRESGKEKWSSLLREAKPVIEFITQSILDQHKDPTNAWKHIRLVVLPEIQAIPSKVAQMAALHQCAVLSGIPEEALRQDFSALPRTQSSESNIQILNKKQYHLSPLEHLAGTIWWLEDTKQNILHEAVMKVCGDYGMTDWLSGVQESYTTRRDELALQAEYYAEEDSIQNTLYVESILQRALIYTYKQDVDRLTLEIRLAEIKMNQNELKNISLSYTDVTKKLARLHSEGVRLLK